VNVQEDSGKKATMALMGPFPPQTNYANFSPNTEVPQKKLSFRHYLFVVLCMSTFRPKNETLQLFENQFHFPLHPNSYDKIARWLAKLSADPGMKLQRKEQFWKELWQQYVEHRKIFVRDLESIPLAHARVRIEELIKLYGEITPTPTKVLEWMETLLDEHGQPKYNKHGRLQQTRNHHIVVEKDIQTAANLLKQIGQEAGTFIEKTEVHHSFDELIKKRRMERGLTTDANIISETSRPEIQNAEEDYAVIPLPSPN